MTLLAAVLASASCGKSSGDDDDDDAGESGNAGAPPGGGGAATAGSAQGGSGAMDSGGSSAQGGSSGGRAGSTGMGGAAAASGSSAPGGGGSGATGGGEGGAAGEPTGTGGSGGTGGTGGDCPGGACVGTCGNEIVEGDESCDDGNAVPFDGCSPRCRIEPSCATGMPCETSCGDGLVSGNETCDDGNLTSGDGCSSDCAEEDGYTCAAADCATIDGQCVVRLPVVFRDFNAHAASGGHPDFAPGFNSDGATQGLVEDLLDMDGKPVQKSGLSTQKLELAYLHGAAAFAQWYRSGAPASQGITGELVLWDDGQGGYVNRWGKSGEQWLGAATQATSGSPYDGSPLFFPLDGKTGTLNETRSEGKVPSQYGWNGYPWESDVAETMGLADPIETSTALFPSTTHNFHFTTEAKLWFRYSAGLEASLYLKGDDDVWVFLNGHLAVDLGGWHVPLEGTLTFDGDTVNAVTQLDADDLGAGPITTRPGTPEAYGLSDGGVYPIQIFHAERQPEGSSFMFGVRGLRAMQSSCAKN